MNYLLILLIAIPIIAADSDSTTNTYHAYLLANYYLAEENLPRAGNYFAQALRNPYAYEGYFHYLYEKKDYKTLANLFQETDSLFKTNRTLQLLYARTLAQLGNQKETVRLYQQLHEQFPHDEQIGYELAMQYMNMHQPQPALKTITRVLNHHAHSPRNFMLYFLQSVLYYQTNQPQQALAAIYKSLEHHPYFDKGQIWLSILQAQLAKQQPHHTTKSISSDLSKAYKLYEQHNYDKAITVVNHYLKLHPADEDARLLKIQILLERNDHVPILSLLEQWLVEQPRNNVWYQVVQLLYYSNVSPTALIALLERIAQQQPQSLAPLYIADLHLRLKQHDQALSSLQRAYMIAEENHHKAYILFQQAGIWYERKQWGLSIQALEQALTLRPTFAPAANLLAYCYVKTKQLQKAQTYVQRALAEQPTNPHFLETQAYCWYKQGNKEKAQSLLEQLAAQLPQDPYIQKHLKRVYKG